MIKNYNSSLESNKIFYHEKDADSIIGASVRNFLEDKWLVLCIGTDRYIGDCLGPVTGTLLKKQDIDFPVFGTLENPVHALNIKTQMERIKNDYTGYKIIAIDACIGNEKNIGSIQVKKGCIFPGKGVGKSLPPIGDIAVIGIVDCSSKDDFLFTHNIRLNTIMKMAEVIVSAITNL